MSEPLRGKQLAEEIALWLETPLGKQLTQEFNLHYNLLHQEAEEAKGQRPSERLTKLDQAAGVKWCIHYLTTRVEALKAGHWEEKKGLEAVKARLKRSKEDVD